MDLSHPKCSNVYDGVCSELWSLSYASIGAAADMVVRQGKGAELVKLDIASASCQYITMTAHCWA